MGKNSSPGKEKARILRAMIKLAQLQALALSPLARQC